MREITSGLQLGVCLGVIFLVFADASTTSNLPKEKLLGLVKRPDTLESSTFELTNPVLTQQDEEEEEERKKNDFDLSHFTKNNNKDENELEQTTIIATTIMTINETNHDIADELDLVTGPITVTIESTTVTPFLDNELETFDRTEKRNNTLRIDEKQNVSSHSEETRTRDSATTTNIPTSVPVTTSVPTTTTLSSYLSESTGGKPLDLTKDSTIVTTTSRDTSIYENTIDRKDSEKKSIVTEPSVVLENSIQQSGNGYRFNNITSESTSSVLSTGTTESISIASSTEISMGTLTSTIPLSYVTSESDDLREKPDFTGNGITENSSPITSTKTTILFTPSSTFISTVKTEAWTTTDETVEEITSSDYYTTLGTSNSDFSTETTIESSDASSTSSEPTSSLSSTSSSTSTVEYEFVGLTESGTNGFATISPRDSQQPISFLDTSSTIPNLTSISNSNNVSDFFSNTRNISETVSWPRMMTERIAPDTLSPNTSISPSRTTNSVTNITVNATDSSIKSIVMATTVGSTTKSLDATPIDNVVTLDVPSSTIVTMIRNNKIPNGKKVTDIIIAATTAATTTTTTTATTAATITTEGPPPDEVTSLVKIIFEGTWQDVCPLLEEFRQSLATYLSNGLGKTFTVKQIHFHQNSCNELSNDENLFSIFVYVVDENGKFDASATKNLPNLYKSIALNFPITIRSILLVQETDSSNAIAVVVVSVVAFICLLLLAGLLFVMRKRQTRFNYGERCRPVSLDAYSLDSVSAYNSVRRKGVTRSSKRSYGNPAFEDSSAIPSHPLNFAGLSSFLNDVDAINEEFSGIPQVSGKMDELPPGAEVKNRYANVIPLPESKVPLRKLNDDPLSEYINANYVRGPKNATKYYIACQAPLDTTVTDFWRMIWEQQCKVIIMLTDLVENGVEKCTEYIPPSEVTDCHRLYGDFQVTLKKRETKEKYAISTLHLKNLENSTFREVYHIWYLWPTTGLQSDGAGLIAVLLEARALQRGGPGPIVVHCSPGTGRTGTLIALDLGIRQYEITRTVDVPRVVYTIRRDRAGAVQTKEQYGFIYKALNLYAAKLAGGMLEST